MGETSIEETQVGDGAQLRVGRYEVLQEIGRGAMGRVFLALDPAIGRQVALKTVSILEGFPEAERREARERFIREARTAGGLLHPNIVTIFDVGEHEGMPFIAMEYVDGGTLEPHCKPADLLEPERAVALAASAARALDHAHAHQIVHRDIKPANLMLTQSGKIKIADFGLAKSSTAGLTQEGMVLGTPYYMSPEQLAGQDLDGRSDLFSLAVVLYELLSGRRPFEAQDVATILYRIAHEPAPPPERAGWPISRALREVLERALAKERDERFANGEALARALEAALRGGRPAAEETVVRAMPAQRAGRTSGGLRPFPQPDPGSRRARPSAQGRWAAAAISGAALVLFPSLANRSVHDAPRPARPAPAAYSVDVPENARLKLDGVPLAGRQLPAAVLQEGRHRLEVETPCEHGMTLLEPGVAPVAPPLTARTLRLPLNTEPPGADIWVDGAATGQRSPAAVELQLCAPHRIELRLWGYDTTALELQPGEDWRKLVADTLRLSREPEGRVWIPAAPYEVSVLYKGRVIGQAGQMLTLPSGPQLLVLRNEKIFLDQPVDVLVAAGETKTLPLEYPRPGSLSVQAHPSNCRISVDGVEVGAPPLLGLPVAPGVHEVRCRLLTTGEEKMQKIQITAGRDSTCQFKF
jgi:hypothetical protein